MRSGLRAGSRKAGRPWQRPVERRKPEQPRLRRGRVRTRVQLSHLSDTGSRLRLKRGATRLRRSAGPHGTSADRCRGTRNAEPTRSKAQRSREGSQTRGLRACSVVVRQLAACDFTAPPPVQQSFPKPALKGGVRVDVNVFEGRIVP
jgi:hypothetical protein